MNRVDFFKRLAIVPAVPLVFGRPEHDGPVRIIRTGNDAITIGNVTIHNHTEAAAIDIRTQCEHHIRRNIVG